MLMAGQKPLAESIKRIFSLSLSKDSPCERHRKQGPREAFSASLLNGAGCLCYIRGVCMPGWIKDGKISPSPPPQSGSQGSQAGLHSHQGIQIRPFWFLPALILCLNCSVQGSIECIEFLFFCALESTVEEARAISSLN